MGCGAPVSYTHLARFEEISRCASEVQDALISILSEKRISIPELALELPAQKGFSVIATANTRDKGVNASCTSLAHLDISSKRAMLPVSMARYTGLFIMASLDGPWAMSMA